MISRTRGIAYVATDVRLYRADDGSWWSTHSSVSRDAVEHYLGRFERVVLLARVCQEDPGPALPVSGDRVDVYPLRNNRSQRGLVVGLAGMWSSLRKIRLGDGDLLVVRIPELVSLAAWHGLRRGRGRRVAVVVADPRGVASYFARGATGRALGRLMTVASRRIVRAADGVIYVTQSALQDIVPCPASVPTLARSNVRVPDSMVVDSARQYSRKSAALRLVAAGNMDSDAKGFDVLVRAVASLRSEGHDVVARILGSGATLPALQHLASGLGVSDFVEFVGHVSSRDIVNAELGAADVFVMPSRTEGLPRALVEAMALGMATIGTRVGGIPELVRDADLVEPGSVADLTRSLRERVLDPSVLQDSARDGLMVARAVLKQTRQPVFDEFIDAVMAVR